MNKFNPYTKEQKEQTRRNNARLRKIIVGAVLGSILLFALLIGALIFSISSIFRSHRSYQVAIDHIKSNSEILAVAGEIQGFGLFPTGNLSVSPNRGDADYIIRVRGTHGDVRVFIVLQRRGVGDWEVVELNFVQR